MGFWELVLAVFLGTLPSFYFLDKALARIGRDIWQISSDIQGRINAAVQDR
jgi:hypothetical protein